MIAETETGAVQGQEQGSTGDATKRSKAARKRINFALAGTLIASGLSYAEVAEKCNAGSVESLRTGLARKGVSLRRLKRVQNPIQGQEYRDTAQVQTVAARAVHLGAEMIRDRLAGQLGQSVDALSTLPVAYPDLASKGQGRAAVLKTLAETHKLLFGGADQTVIVFGVESMGESHLEPAIDVTSTVSDVNTDNT